MTRIAIAQMKNEGTIEDNLQKSLKCIQEAADQKAQLILFPEVQLTEFFPQYPGKDVSHYAMEIDHPIIQSFQTAAKRNHIITCPNIYLKEDGKCYDTTLVIDENGEIIGKQKMVHVAYAEQFYETDYYTPSDTGFHVFDTSIGRIGVVVCFDRHYPESVRTEVLRGADLILIPTVNQKSEPMELFEQEIRVQAFHNSVYIAMANRVGKEDAMEFAGESIVVDPAGNTIYIADDQEQIIVVDIDLAQAKQIRNQKPYTQLRRKELYE